MGLLTTADLQGARWISDAEMLRYQRDTAGKRAEAAANPYANRTLLLRRDFGVRPGLRRAVVAGERPWSL